MQARAVEILYELFSPSHRTPVLMQCKAPELGEGTSAGRRWGVGVRGARGTATESAWPFVGRMRCGPKIDLERGDYNYASGAVIGEKRVFWASWTPGGRPIFFFGGADEEFLQFLAGSSEFADGAQRRGAGGSVWSDGNLLSEVDEEELDTGSIQVLNIALLAPKGDEVLFFDEVKTDLDYIYFRRTNIESETSSSREATSFECPSRRPMESQNKPPKGDWNTLIVALARGLGNRNWQSGMGHRDGTRAAGRNTTDGQRGFDLERGERKSTKGGVHARGTGRGVGAAPVPEREKDRSWFNFTWGEGKRGTRGCWASRCGCGGHTAAATGDRRDGRDTFFWRFFFFFGKLEAQLFAEFKISQLVSIAGETVLGGRKTRRMFGAIRDVPTIDWTGSPRDTGNADIAAEFGLVFDEVEPTFFFK
ncbi:hypothetical protein FB451DRAFT_1164486 [Mycena latifolia]|nr:hypothetical protein FB451DRAFT_1164486 [Mycena latifolia]